MGKGGKTDENMIPIMLDVNGKIPQAETKVKQNDTGSHSLDITVLDRSQPVDLTGCRAGFLYPQAERGGGL